MWTPTRMRPASAPSCARQSKRLNLLFLCSRNQWRSPTAERLWRKTPGVSTRFAGLSKSARRRVSEADVIWADAILVMEEAHKSRLARDHRAAVADTPIHVLDIPDDYRFMDPELVSLSRTAVTPILTSLEHKRR